MDYRLVVVMNMVVGNGIKALPHKEGSTKPMYGDFLSKAPLSGLSAFNLHHFWALIQES